MRQPSLTTEGWRLITHKRLACVAAIVVVLSFLPRSAAASTPQFNSIADRDYDAVERRTDLGASAPFDSSAHHLVELIGITIGRWSSTAPQVDLFAGAFVPGGNFVRIDVELDGLHNPPGKSVTPGFNPFMYGDHPVYGFIEFDVDDDNQTGGEVDAPEYRYLGNVARFGGIPEDSEFENRAAIDASDFDGNFLTKPYVERHGEEFHLALLGGQFNPSDVNFIEGDTDTVFESGETWDIDGRWFHRAHGFEPYSIASGGAVPGEYAPICTLRFHHDVGSDHTTLSLVFPLTNVAAASITGAMPQPNNHDPSDQASLLEALDDLAISASFIEMFPTGEPEEQLILGWKDKSPGAFFNAGNWRFTALLGTSYTASGYGFVWTDVWPDPMRGNVNAEVQVNDDDRDEIEEYIEDHDADDGTSDDRVELLGFASDFCVYDINHDGVVEHLDELLVTEIGDGNQDGDVDLHDFARFQRCVGWTAGGGGSCGVLDLDANGLIDSNDLNWFSHGLSGPGTP